MALPRPIVRAVTAEVDAAITGGWIQKISQPAARTLVLELRAHGRTLRLLLSADPDTARVHLAEGRLANPATPPVFCQYLRAHIQGARIDAVEQMNQDRIMRVTMTARGGHRTLIAEMTGRKADLLLLDEEDRVLVGLDPGRHRVGEPYRPPPAPPDARENDATIDGRSIAPDALFPISSWIETHYQRQEAERSRARLVQQRRTELTKRIKKATRRLDALRSDFDKASRYRDYARYGELLKTQVGSIHKGVDRTTVIDYFDPALPELVLPLDPAKSPHANLDDYFKKHKKYLAAESQLRPRIAEAEAELAALKAERTALERGEVEPRPPHRVPHDDPSSRKTVTDHTKRRLKPGPFRRFVSSDGCLIYVGRNAAENETLTFGEARPDDLWLHAQGVPGSHVVVRLEKGMDAPSETLVEAATLAVLYSDLKKSGKGDVIYTRRKHVRKAKGKGPGTVTVTQEKSVFVTLDRMRLDALKARQRLV